MNKIELKDAVEQAMDLIVDGQSSDALARLWAVHRELRDIIYLPDMPDDTDRVYADSILLSEARASVALDGDTYSLLDDKHERIRARDRARKQRDRDRARAADNFDDLPPMKTINGKPPRSKTKPIDVSCMTCGAPKGRLCFQMSGPGRHSKVVPDTEVKTFHASRRKKAMLRG